MTDNTETSLRDDLAAAIDAPEVALDTNEVA
jgi:hypothetical protein